MKNKTIWGLVFLLVFTLPSPSQFTSAVVSISGTVKNALTKEPMTVYVVAYDQNGKKVNVARSNSSDNGYYFLTGLKPGNNYKIVVEQTNFIREEYVLNIPQSSNYMEYSKDFSLIPISKGSLVPIPVPPFELNKTKLRFGSEEYLDKFAKAFAENKSFKLVIICYPDYVQNKSDNKKLTEERAKSIMAYFISKGVEPERINIEGNTDPDPKNPPPTQKRAKGKRYIGTSYILIN
ncbi:MAG: OmpA family protein [Candidatus Kapaibacteriales bacterium]